MSRYNIIVIKTSRVLCPVVIMAICSGNAGSLQDFYLAVLLNCGRPYQRVPGIFASPIPCLGKTFRFVPLFLWNKMDKLDSGLQVLPLGFKYLSEHLG